MNHVRSGAALLAVFFLAACSEDDLTTFQITIENVSPTGLLDTDRADGAAPLSAGIYTVAEDTNPIFQAGEDATIGLERLAEDGIVSNELGGQDEPTTILDEVQEDSRVLDFGTISSPGGPDSLAGLWPGETATFTFEAEQGEELQLAMMFVQSNDWFLAFQGDGLDLFDILDQPRNGEVTDELALYDAGTEVDEAPGQGEFQPLVANVNEGDEENVNVQTVSARDFTFGVPNVEDFVRVTVVALDNSTND